MEKRITKRDNFNAIKTIVAELGREDLVEFVNHELELLDNRAKRNTLTKVQKENLEYVEVIYNILANAEEPMTIDNILAADSEVATFSNQKISALLKKLVDADRIVKTVIKNKAYFSIAD